MAHFGRYSQVARSTLLVLTIIKLTKVVVDKTIRVSARIQFVGPEYAVIVSALPEGDSTKADVDLRLVQSQAEAILARDKMIQEMQERVRSRGDRLASATMTANGRPADESGDLTPRA